MKRGWIVYYTAEGLEITSNSYITPIIETTVDDNGLNKIETKYLNMLLLCKDKHISHLKE